jgi:hypothetical protein
MILILGTALYAAIAINYVGALVYDNNMKFVPVPNPNCTRFLPQIKLAFNLNDTVSLNSYRVAKNKWYTRKENNRGTKRNLRVPFVGPSCISTNNSALAHCSCLQELVLHGPLFRI